VDERERVVERVPDELAVGELVCRGVRVFVRVGGAEPVRRPVRLKDGDEDDVLDAAIVFERDGHAVDVLEARIVNDRLGDAVAVLEARAEDVVVLVFAAVQVDTSLANDVLVIRIVGVGFCVADAVFEPVVVRVDVVDLTGVVVTGAVSVWKAVGFQERVPVVVFVDVLESVVDSVGSMIGLSAWTSSNPPISNIRKRFISPYNKGIEVV
jgi:hypothetical protein